MEKSFEKMERDREILIAAITKMIKDFSFDELRNVYIYSLQKIK